MLRKVKQNFFAGLEVGKDFSYDKSFLRHFLSSNFSFFKEVAIDIHFIKIHCFISI